MIIPTKAWVWSHPARILAFGFGSGLSPRAPGTVGTLYAWAIYLVMDLFLDSTGIALIVSLGAVLGCWICGKVGEELGVPDHGGIVWDEFIAFWLILLLCMPMSVWGQLGAFALFRFFDAVKPGPIKMIDQYFKNYNLVDRMDQPTRLPLWFIKGFGVMIDDLAAAFATLLVITILVRIW